MEPKDLGSFAEELNVFELQGMEALKKRRDLVERVRFDVTPRMIMEPRLEREKRKEVAGCFFYIEALEPPPSVMLMKVNPQGVTSTVAKVDTIPPAMVERAVAQPVEPPVNNMYAISGEIEDWLRGELGL